MDLWRNISWETVSERPGGVGPLKDSDVDSEES